MNPRRYYLVFSWLFAIMSALELLLAVYLLAVGGFRAGLVPLGLGLFTLYLFRDARVKYYKYENLYR